MCGAERLVIDLFSGLGGWSLGARAVGIDTIGIDNWEPACLTRAALGLRTIRADVATYPTAVFRSKTAGLIASPPCPDWSRAGKRRTVAGKTGQLVAQVIRWAVEVRPTWIACEQVDTVLPVWRLYARALERLGYRSWTGMLDTADYGVPQNRRRAYLLAHLGAQPHPPEPTHAEHPATDLDGRQLEPWVSMAEALGWGFARRPSLVVRGGGGGSNCLEGGSHSRKVLREAAKSEGQWRLATGAKTERGDGAIGDYDRDPERPSPAVLPNADRWKLRSGGHATADWTWERPATTICGGSRVFTPGQHFSAGRDPAVAKGRSEDAIQITLAEALILQGFDPGTPVQGRTKADRFTLVGNAVPPPMAAAILRVLVSLPHPTSKDLGTRTRDWTAYAPDLSGFAPRERPETPPPLSLPI